MWPSCGCSVVAYLLLCVGCNIYAAELLNKRERRTEVSHEAFIMHSHICFVTVFVVFSVLRCNYFLLQGLVVQ